MDLRLKIAVQKAGRLHDGSLSLLGECGIRIDNGFDQLIAPARDFPADVLFLRNSDIPGSVEIAPNIGLADGICDLVSSGSTLFKNGLKEAEVILKSEACLVKGPGLNNEKQAVADEILFRIRSVLASRNNKYILLNAPDDKLEDICNILPGMKSPTIMPLAMEGWSSLHSVISEADFWAVIGQLKKKGAQGILVIPIEKMVV
ncbi:MAG: hypothetical protein U9N72_05725 [Bacteroidota bacterium]|nr:hypothetical protein [Bacteroidota bacterium]